MNLHAHRPADVDRFMAALDHPLRAEVQALRDIILAVDDRITEQIKWKAPSFSCGDYIATFNLRARQHVHLVFHNPHLAAVDSDLLSGSWPDRRMAYFTDLATVEAKRAELERVVREIIRHTSRPDPRPATAATAARATAARATAAGSARTMCG